MYDHVLSITGRILSELDVDRVLTASLDGLIELCRAERGMILLLDGAGNLSFEKARNLERRDVEHPEFKVSRSVIRRVRAEGRAFFDPSLASRPASDWSESIERLELIAVICLPLVHEGEVFGVVYLDTRQDDHRFTDETRDLAAGVADNVIASAARNALERHRLRRRVESLEKELRAKHDFQAIVGEDPAMMKVLRRVAQVAPSEVTVLIEGESGTGKELIARALHYNSERADGPFVPVNCGAVPENLQEAELFGHEKGAFTGAVKSNPGWFERAHGGTLFLDEVGEMPLALQVKFLRVLETGEYAPVGSTTIRRADVRVVAATNRDTDELVREGRMRQDLLFRLAVIRLHVPPLRERPVDLRLLTRHFLDRFGEQMGRPLELSPEAESALEAHSYPGNVRELHNILQAAALIAEGPLIDVEDLPDAVSREDSAAGPLDGVLAGDGPPGLSFKKAKQRVVASFEREYLRRCLEASQGNVSQAARMAEIDVKNFHTKMKRHGIDRLDFRE